MHFFQTFLGTRISIGVFALTASMLSLATSQDFQGYNFAAEAESLLDAPLVKEFSCEGTVIVLTNFAIIPNLQDGQKNSSNGRSTYAEKLVLD